MNYLWLLLNSIFIILFNVTFFVALGFSHASSVWMAYAFIHVSYVAVLVTPKLTPQTKSKMVLGVTLDAISIGYFFIELLLGVVIILLAPAGWIAPFLVQFTLFCAYLFTLIANLIANKHTIENETQCASELSYHKTICYKITVLREESNSARIKKKMEELYDSANSSQTKSHADMAEIEQKILARIDLLEQELPAKPEDDIIATINSAIALIKKRDQSLRLFN